MSAFEIAGGGLLELHDETLGADTASFDVSGIVEAYQSLHIICMLRCTTLATSEQGAVRLNNDSGANYDRASMLWTGGSLTGFNSVAQTSMGFGAVAAANATADLFSNVNIDIPFYASTTFKKVIDAQTMTRYGTAAADQENAQTCGIWRSTAAVTRVTILPTAGNFKAGSRIVIYGVR